MSEVDATFRRLAGSLDCSVLIVTADDGERREGCVAGFATQTSFRPPRFLVCVSRASRTSRLVEQRGIGALAVHAVPGGAEALVVAEVKDVEPGRRA